MRFVWYFNTSVTMKSFMLWRCWTDAMECSQLATLFYFDPCPVVRSTRITEADQKRTPFLLSFVFWKYLIDRKRKQIWNSTCGGVQGWVGWTKALRFLLGRPVGGFGLWGELLTSFNFCLCSNVLRGRGTRSLTFVFVWILLTTDEKDAAVKLAMLVLCLWYSECSLWRTNVRNRGPQLGRSPWNEFKRKETKVTSSHSAPWNTTRPSHSRHLDGALSFLSLWVWAAFDIWVLRKGPGELAVSITISLTPRDQRNTTHKNYKWIYI